MNKWIIIIFVTNCCVCSYAQGNLPLNFEPQSIFPNLYKTYEEDVSNHRVHEALTRIKEYAFSQIMSDADSALFAYEWLLRLGQYHGIDSFEIYGFAALKTLHKMKGQYQKCIDYAYEQNKRTLSYDGFEPSDLNGDLGFPYLKLAQFDSAQYYLKKAYLEAINSGDSADIQGALNNLGVLYSYLNEYEFAVKYYLNSLNLAQSRGNNYALTFAQSNLGFLFTKLNDFKSAKQYLNDGLSIAIEHGFEAIAARINMQQAWVMIEESHLDSAKQLLTQAQTQFESSHNAPNLTQCHQLLARIAYMNGNYFSALEHLRTAGSLSKEIDEQSLKTTQLITIGELYTQMDNYSKANMIMRQAWKSANNHSLTTAKRDILKWFANYHRLLNNLDSAYHYSHKLLMVNDSLDILNQSRLVYELQTQNEQLQKDQEIQYLHERRQEEQKKLGLQRRLNASLAALLVGAFIILGFLLSGLRKNKLIARQQQEIHNKVIEVKEQEASIERMHALMEGQELERKRIAGDLHDGLGTLLAGIRLQLESFEQPENIERQQMCDYMKNRMAEAYEEVRRISHDMMPSVLTKFGLVDALRHLCSQWNAGNDLQVDFEIIGDPKPLVTSHKIMLYRICQELLNNVSKHAEARNVIVQYCYLDDEISLSVEDDGKGFDRSKMNGESLGFRSIATRVKSLNGNFEIDSKPTQGTSILVSFPV